VFDHVVLILLDAGEKTSHRYKLSLAGDKFELLETWCIGNEASSGKTLNIPSCTHVLLCHEVEGTIWSGASVRAREGLQKSIIEPLFLLTANCWVGGGVKIPFARAY
jgi:hypothetical protein